jgi:hypothetical protein
MWCGRAIGSNGIKAPAILQRAAIEKILTHLGFPSSTDFS